MALDYREQPIACAPTATWLDLLPPTPDDLLQSRLARSGFAGMAVEAKAVQQTAQRVALVAGASGLTGGALLRALLASTDYTRILAVTRRPLLQDHPRLANRVLPFEQLQTGLAGQRCTDAFCCIGAPQGRRGSYAQLRPVDVDLTLTFARTAQSLGATRLVVVSAAGADRRVTRPFLRAKGEMEAGLRELRFANVDILQPGVVLGMRAQAKASDLVELALRPLLNPLLHGALAARRSMTAEDLAAAMLGAARSQRSGIHQYAGTTLQELARRGRGAS
jgi:uncharacterized protein YbjT (DUF2867 family)